MLVGFNAAYEYSLLKISTIPLEILADVLFVPPAPMPAPAPQRITLPSVFNAANAPYDARIDTTPVSPDGTVPPLLAFPQHTTVPSDFNAANDQ